MRSCEQAKSSMCYAAVGSVLWRAVPSPFPVFTHLYSLNFVSDFFFLLPFEKDIQEQKLLSLLYYLNNWYIIVEKLNYLQ